MSKPPVKSTVHGSDPTAVPTVKDVYQEDVLSVSNEVKTESPVSTAATDYLKNTNLGMSDIVPTVKDSIGSNSDGLAFDFGVAKTRVERAFGVTGSTGELSNKQKSDIGNALTTLTGTKQSKLVFGESVKTLSADTDALTVSSLTRTLNSISGQGEVFKLIDLEAQAGFIKGISDTVISLGVPSLLDKLLDSIDDSKTKNELLEENAMKAAGKGDLDATRHFCEKMGQNRANQIHRDLIPELMAGYKISDDETRSFRLLGEDLLSFFNWLNGTWDRDPYDKTLICYEFHTYANVDAVSALTYTDIGPSIVIGSQLTIDKPLTIAGKLFPDMVDWQ